MRIRPLSFHILFDTISLNILHVFIWQIFVLFFFVFLGLFSTLATCFYRLLLLLLLLHSAEAEPFNSVLASVFIIATVIIMWLDSFHSFVLIV